MSNFVQLVLFIYTHDFGSTMKWIAQCYTSNIISGSMSYDFNLCLLRRHSLQSEWNWLLTWTHEDSLTFREKKQITKYSYRDLKKGCGSGDTEGRYEHCSLVKNALVFHILWSFHLWWYSVSVVLVPRRPEILQRERLRLAPKDRPLWPTSQRLLDRPPSVKPLRHGGLQYKHVSAAGPGSPGPRTRRHHRVIVVPRLQNGDWMTQTINFRIFF